MGTIQLRANGINFTLDECGEGESIALLLHGFPEARQAWRNIAPTLAGLGWRVLAPDLRGYGDTDRPATTEAYRLEHLAKDVDALFEAAGARRRILVGHDWGGVIAWRYALSAKAKLDGLVILNAPHPQRFREIFRSHPAQALRSWYVTYFHIPWLPEFQLRRSRGRPLMRLLRRQSAAIPDDLLELYRRNLLRAGAARAMVDYYRANAAALSLQRPAAETLKVPTLMLWGLEDAFLDRALAKDNERFVANLQVAPMPGVSHWIIHDAEREVAERIRTWTCELGEELLCAS